jgi:release factor glutamine methyltransferase
MPSIKDLIAQSEIDKKEAVLLAANLLQQPKEYIIAHDDLTLSKRQISHLKKLFAKRQHGLPIAYILGKKEFYGRDFLVNKNVLIPRPETETIIDVVKNLADNTSAKNIIDIGTGSGCIGITLKLERPKLAVTLSDISQSALKIAKTNAQNLKADVKFTRSNLLKNLPNYIIYDIIIANLPYVSPDWQLLPDLKFEPKKALFASDGGLKTVKRLIQTAPTHLSQGGLLALELDPCQHPEIIKFAAQHHFKLKLVNHYTMVLILQGQSL